MQIGDDVKKTKQNWRLATWRLRQTHCASSHNQKKDDNKFKNKNQPELTENRTVWKSDNQGIKEETFIQTGTRILGADRDSADANSWGAAQKELQDYS